MRDDLEQWRVPEPYPTAGRAIDYLLIDSRTGFVELDVHAAACCYCLSVPNLTINLEFHDYSSV